MENPPYLVVGHLNKPHGTKGELFIWPLTDHPERHFAPGVVVLLGDDTGDSPSDTLPPLEISAVRPYRRGFLAQFRGVDDRTGAEAFQGRYLLRRFEDIGELDEGELFYHQWIGLEVVTRSGVHVGKVVELYELRPADLLEVRGEDRDLMIPLLEGLVVSVDLEAGRLVIDPPEGLLDL